MGRGGGSQPQQGLARLDLHPRRAGRQRKHGGLGAALDDDHAIRAQRPGGGREGPGQDGQPVAIGAHVEPRGRGQPLGRCGHERPAFGLADCRRPLGRQRRQRRIGEQHEQRYATVAGGDLLQTEEQRAGVQPDAAVIDGQQRPVEADLCDPSPGGLEGAGTALVELECVRGQLTPAELVR